METTFTTNGQAELSVTHWGSEGASIVALHPGVGDSRIWKWCAPVWSDAGYRVIAYDRRGYGATRYEEEAHDDLADLLAVMSDSDSNPAVIVGNSLGGGLALDLALEHPDHVVGLVLIAPSPSGYPDDDWPLSTAESSQDRLIGEATDAQDLDLVNRLEVRYWLDGVEQPEGRVRGPARDLMTAMNGRALSAESTGESPLRPPAWPVLDQIRVPTLVVVGEHDLPGVHLLCARTAETIPHALLTTIPKSAHCPSLDQPEALNRAILGFLTALGASRIF